MNTSIRPIIVRVLPVPVAMTINAFRFALCKGFTHAPNGFMLIGAVNNLIIDLDGTQRLFILADVKQVLQIYAREEPEYLTLGGDTDIYKVNGISVCQKP